MGSYPEDYEPGAELGEIDPETEPENEDQARIEEDGPDMMAAPVAEPNVCTALSEAAQKEAGS